MTEEKTKEQKALDVSRAINKKFGKGTVVSILNEEGQADEVEAISTSSIALDLATGIGGVPRGRIVEIYGPEAGGKTQLALQIIAECQKNDGLAGFIDAERTLHGQFAISLGVNVKDLTLVHCECGEEGLGAAQEMIKSGIYDLVVVDSVAALTPKAEIDADLTDQQIGLQARMMSKACRMLSNAVSETKTCLIFINQLRVKINPFGGKPTEVTPAGKALKFWSSMRLDIRKGADIKHGEAVIGHWNRVKVVKNKHAIPYGIAEYENIYGHGIDKEGEILDYGLKYGLINQSGAWYAIGDERMGQGRIKAKQYLRDNPEIAQELKKEILEAEYAKRRLYSE